MNKVLSTVAVIVIAIVVMVWAAVVFVVEPSPGLLSETESPNPSPEVELSVVVKSTVHPSLGNYLTDGMGKTLYVYGKDESSKSSCEGECAQKWMPYYVANPEGPEGFGPSDDNLLKRINVLQRTDGSYQYAYGEKPLYYYYKDKQPGDVNGNDINEFWSIVSVD